MQVHQLMEQGTETFIAYDNVLSPEVTKSFLSVVDRLIGLADFTRGSAAGAGSSVDCLLETQGEQVREKRGEAVEGTRKSGEEAG